MGPRPGVRSGDWVNGGATAPAATTAAAAGLSSSMSGNRRTMAPSLVSVSRLSLGPVAESELGHHAAVGQVREVRPAVHPPHQQLRVELVVAGVAELPAGAPLAESEDQGTQLLPRTGEEVVIAYVVDDAGVLQLVSSLVGMVASVEWVAGSVAMRRGYDDFARTSGTGSVPDGSTICTRRPTRTFVPSNPSTNRLTIPWQEPSDDHDKHRDEFCPAERGRPALVRR